MHLSGPSHLEISTLQVWKYFYIISLVIFLLLIASSLSSWNSLYLDVKCLDISSFSLLGSTPILIVALISTSLVKIVPYLRLSSFEAEWRVGEGRNMGYPEQGTGYPALEDMNRSCRTTVEQTCSLFEVE